MKPAALLATMLLMAACGSGPTASVGSPSPSSNSTPTPASSPTSTSSPAPATFCNPSSPCLALVTLRGSDNVVVRDLTDFAHPKTVGNLGSNRATFVRSTVLGYTLNGTLGTVPLSGSPWAPVAGAPKDAGSPVWSPDGTAVAYFTGRGSYETGDQHLDVHLLRAGTDQIVGSTPGLGGPWGCEYVANCSQTNWVDVRLAFSPDGKFFSFVAQGIGGSFFYLWSSDGTLLKGDSAQSTTMSTWSGNWLYFRDQGGVEAWRDGSSSKFLPRVQWIRPSASPAGGKVVFTVRDSAGWGHIYMADTVTGKLRGLKAQRSDAVFLTSRYVWYYGERACVAADQCGPNPPFHPDNGKTYIYDLQTGLEYTSIITSVIDVWPHAA
jgi:hypothetical protein